MDEKTTLFPRTRKAIQLIDDVFYEYYKDDYDTEFDDYKRSIIDHPMMDIARAIYDDSGGWAEDLYDYLGALIREKERNDKERLRYKNSV